MRYKLWAYVSLGVIVLIAVGWDIFAITSLGSDQATVSRVTYEMAQRYPVIPLLFGILLGHLLWPQSKEVSKS